MQIFCCNNKIFHCIFIDISYFQKTVLIISSCSFLLVEVQNDALYIKGNLGEFSLKNIQKWNSLKGNRELARPALLNRTILCNSSMPNNKEVRTLNICLVHSYLSIHMSQTRKYRGDLIDRLIDFPNIR